MPGSSGINHDVFRYRVGVMGVDSMDSFECTETEERECKRRLTQKKPKLFPLLGLP
jgi:hypothetical protein